jgi:transposase
VKFCIAYRTWAKKQKLTMRQEHRAGEKMFVDYSGKKLHVVNATTGEVVEVELFVAVLGASSYTYAEATWTQRSVDFVASNARALAFYGGVTRALVPDQLKSAVTGASRYEPEIQRAYEDFARHYGTVVLPARPRRPRDKAKVEVAVQVVQRWIVARLRNETFFTLAELNARIAELLVDLNDRKMRDYQASRRELFERIDRPALLPLPATAYEHADWKRARVNIDYHAELDHHFYSAPHSLVHEEVEFRYTATTVEILCRGIRVASHVRSFRRGGFTTVPEHMPKAHQKHLQWTPSRIISWASAVGPKTSTYVTAILAERTHPEQGYRSCLGILRLSKQYGNERLEAACERANLAGARSYRSVDSILRAGLDRLPLRQPESTQTELFPSHENVRGPLYYN